ncbi:MAG TPA: DUF5655 domain-containing protein [Methanofastidiosum sp.]|jgi:predicted transport protein|nr:DUF5655 domain-containing protein [Methanofastidiosum sp.]HOR88460.1 DUF5655 domain-containing protein [Methanofastidiosum sp.]HPL00603.1 DUF5655 domain-containing protein [Methanofastidiosum sp.]
MIIYHNSKEYKEYSYAKEEDFEKDIITNSKLFFGQNTIYIDAKKKIESKSFGGTIPDGFLFDFSDKENPEFYIVEAELAKHSFYEHIFAQITKFFAFYKNKSSHSELIDKLYKIVKSDGEIEREFLNFIGKKEIYKSIKDTLDASQNILLMIDGEKRELPEMFDTYAEWGTMVKYIILKKYTNNSESIFSMHPEFQNIEYITGTSVEDIEEEVIEYDEDFHFNKSSPATKEIYQEIKQKILEYNESAYFNPQRSYISIKTNRNVAYFKFRKTKVRLIIMMDEGIVRSKIQSHEIKSLSESVQKFYNGPCCAIDLNSKKELGEVINLLIDVVGREKER